jgi:hypothetical protein
MNAPTEPRPFPGAPEYFRQLYVPPETGRADVIVLVDEPLVIYGIAQTSPYPEDHEYERQVWREHQGFMAWCFSPLCPEGEPGTVALADVVAIPAEEFTGARDAGWPQEWTAAR